MNPTQIITSAAPVIAFIAGLLAGRGVFGFDQATWITILTAVGGLGATIWAAFTTRKTAMVTAVANMPEVKSVSLEPSASGATAVAAATPGNVTIAH